MHDSDIVEFELKSKRFSLSVRKKEAIQAEQAAALQVGYRATARVQRLGVPALGGRGRGHRTLRTLLAPCSTRTRFHAHPTPRTVSLQTIVIAQAKILSDKPRLALRPVFPPGPDPHSAGGCPSGPCPSGCPW